MNKLFCIQIFLLIFIFSSCSESYECERESNFFIAEFDDYFIEPSWNSGWNIGEGSRYGLWLTQSSQDPNDWQINFRIHTRLHQEMSLYLSDIQEVGSYPIETATYQDAILNPYSKTMLFITDQNMFETDESRYIYYSVGNSGFVEIKSYDPSGTIRGAFSCEMRHAPTGEVVNISGEFDINLNTIGEFAKDKPCWL